MNHYATLVSLNEQVSWRQTQDSSWVPVITTPSADMKGLNHV